MKKSIKKLNLLRETVKNLAEPQLTEAAAGLLTGVPCHSTSCGVYCGTHSPTACF
jgi:hypothetical protein